MSKPLNNTESINLLCEVEYSLEMLKNKKGGFNPDRAGVLDLMNTTMKFFRQYVKEETE
jgi:hypothetical protein